MEIEPLDVRQSLSGDATYPGQPQVVRHIKGGGGLRLAIGRRPFHARYATIGAEPPHRKPHFGRADVNPSPGGFFSRAARCRDCRAAGGGDTGGGVRGYWRRGFGGGGQACPGREKLINLRGLVPRLEQVGSVLSLRLKPSDLGNH